MISKTGLLQPPDVKWAEFAGALPSAKDNLNISS